MWWKESNKASALLPSSLGLCSASSSCLVPQIDCHHPLLLQTEHQLCKSRSLHGTGNHGKDGAARLPQHHVLDGHLQPPVGPLHLPDARWHLLYLCQLHAFPLPFGYRYFLKFLILIYEPGAKFFGIFAFTFVGSLQAYTYRSSSHVEIFMLMG